MKDDMMLGLSKRRLERLRDQIEAEIAEGNISAVSVARWCRQLALEMYVLIEAHEAAGATPPFEGVR